MSVVYWRGCVYSLLEGLCSLLEGLSVVCWRGCVYSVVEGLCL